MSISTHMNIYIYMHAQMHIGINIVYISKKDIAVTLSLYHVDT